ncbi:hypothetical protein ACUXAV_006118 [Cupriavidus metallidurans]|nr:hypothetical protein AU374_00898 [Cupriavidus metallidurans]
MRVAGRRRPTSSDQWPAGDLLAAGFPPQKDGATPPQTMTVTMSGLDVPSRCLRAVNRKVDSMANPDISIWL